MGRRSINTTKSGKYMNPTDQARKEARKKELKKNKRQRQMVRAAVLKNKDPGQILEEMEKIDEMEYNVLQPSPLNEKVLRDKRKKLKETFDRVMRLYHTDEPEHWAELKRKEVEYEKKRMKKQQYYESVKHAQTVQIDEIPLPASATAPSVTTSSTMSTPSAAVSFPSGAIRIPPPPTSLSLPPFAPSAPPSALKKPFEHGHERSEKTTNEGCVSELLGVPPGPPPDLFAMSELDTDAEDDEVVLKRYSPKRKSATRRKSKSTPKAPNSLQQRMLAISGQNIDEFMREMENVHKKKEKERESVLRGAKPHISDDDEKDSDDNASGHEDNDVKEHEEDAYYDNEYDSDTKSSKSPDRHSDSGSVSSDESDADKSPSAASIKRRNQELLNADHVSSGRQITTANKTKSTSNVTPVAIPLPPVLPTSVPPPHLALSHGVHRLAPPPPPSMLFRPPPLRPHAPGMPSYGLRMPPGPPPGPRPHGMVGLPTRMGLRMPPGPPPGMPPRLQQHQKPHPSHQHPSHQIQLPPHQQQLQHNKELSKGVTTITAKPQIRNLSADVTRFVPSTLRVKREETRKPARAKPFTSTIETSNFTSEATKTTTKDDAYMQFMNEMQGLL